MSRYYTGVGSRLTPTPILKKMHRIAIEKRKAGFILRSGGARGADTAFEKGAGFEKEIWLPWLNFNGNPSTLIPTPEAFSMVLKFHPSPEALMFSRVNWQLHARNVHQVLGFDLNTPSEELICYTDKGGMSGGTATAIRIAQAYNIPVRNLGL